MTDVGVQELVLSDLSSAELQTLCVALVVPPLVGLGVHPLDDISDDERVALMYRSMTSLADRGYVNRVGPGDFAVAPWVAQVMTAAGRPSAVIRILELANPEEPKVAFIYGIEELAVVHELQSDGTHRLLAKSLAQAVHEVSGILASFSSIGFGEDRRFTLRRGVLMSDDVLESTVDDGLLALITAARSAAASGQGIRVDVAWVFEGEAVEPYLAVLGADGQEHWLLTGIGQSSEDEITCHSASAHHVVEGFAAVLKGSVFAGPGASE
jgi:hypothetical protein